MSDEKKDWSVAVSSLISNLRHGLYKSADGIDAAIDSQIEELENARKYMINQYSVMSECVHVYKDPTYTIQKRLICYMRVNVRVCGLCFAKEYYQESTEEHCNDRPEWVKDASEKYYNNNF